MTLLENNVSRRRLIMSIIELSPLPGAKLSRHLVPVVTGLPLTQYLASKGIHPVNISQGLAGQGKPGTQRARVRGLVADALDVSVTDIWPPKIESSANITRPAA